MKVRGTSSRKVALVRIVRTLAVMNMIDELGDEEVQIGVALAVGMARQVHRHAIDVDAEVGAVVEIEAAQEILVRLAAAAVLRDHHAGNAFQHVGWAEQRTVLDPRSVDVAFARRSGPRRPSCSNQNNGGFRQIVGARARRTDRKSTRLNSSHGYISYAVFCLKKKKK